ncbi:P1 family peptidase [Sorangium sp. So ce375]|uniref:P1 family peptidase n=1 Tax=Sorangium sp. So ce375 TaxID=3133306 RepID=UPI003F5BE66D
MRCPRLPAGAALAAALLLPSLLACAGPRARPLPPAPGDGASPAPRAGEARRRANRREVDDARLNPMFQGAEEAVEEAILNAMTMATTTFGQDDHVAHAIPLDRLREVMRRYGRLGEPGR